MEERYGLNFSEYLATFKKQHPFFPGGFITKALNEQLEEILGPKTEKDMVKKEKKKEPKATNAPK